MNERLERQVLKQTDTSAAADGSKTEVPEAPEAERHFQSDESGGLTEVTRNGEPLADKTEQPAKPSTERREAIKSRFSGIFSRMKGMVDAGVDSSVFGKALSAFDTVRGKISSARDRLVQTVANGKQRTSDRIQAVKNKARIIGYEIAAPVADRALAWWNQPLIERYHTQAANSDLAANQFTTERKNIGAQLESISIQRASLDAQEAELRSDLGLMTEGEKEHRDQKWEHMAAAKEVTGRRSRARMALEALRQGPVK